MCERLQYTQAWLTLRRFFLPFSPSFAGESWVEAVDLRFATGE
jgi:hypothetical protein